MNTRNGESTSGSYKPNLFDVAKLVHATGSGEPKPEVTLLFQWLVDQVPELREIALDGHLGRVDEEFVPVLVVDRDRFRNLKRPRSPARQGGGLIDRHAEAA